MAARYLLADQSQVEWTTDEGMSFSFFLPGDTPVHVDFAVWLGLGNSVADFVADEITSISRYQMQHHLKNIGKLAQVRTLALTWSADSDARIEWETGLIMKDGPLLVALVAEYGFTDAQVTNFFNLAALI